MQSQPAFVVVGSFGIDTNVYPVGERRGAEMMLAHTTDGLGQAGCYSALAASALGLPTSVIAAIGDDRAGAWVREELMAAGIALTELRDPGGTHRSVNIVATDGSRSNYFDPRRVSETVVDLEACEAVLEGARVVHFSLDDWARQLLAPAVAADAVVSCDLQDVADIDDPYRADFVEAAEVLFMSGANLSDSAAAARQLAARRIGRVVLVGLGPQGCLIAHDREVDHQRAVDLADYPVVDTNGAGDNLAVGFLVARYVDGLPLDQAAWRAQLGARWICAQRGDAKRPLGREQLALLAKAAGGPDAPP
jgi:sugar/nucleoside kinase (ribokinase family)